MTSITQTEVDFKVVETSPGNVVLVRLYQVTEDRYHVMSEQANGNDKGNTWGGDSIPFDGAPMVADPVSEQEEYGLEARG